jgi:hypothetical protein
MIGDMDSSSYAQFLARAVDTSPTPEVTGGASGYFSAPQQGLDPRLFNGDTFHQAVRHWVLDTLYAYWDTKYHDPRSWSTVWVAGSGVSYQWAASRGGLGDLDILMGVDFDDFYAANPKFLGINEADMCDIFNVELHTELLPKTESITFHAPDGMINSPFEVTFYVNPLSSDIRRIHPYAAYNLTDDEWTVKPPELPQDPRLLYPAEFSASVDAEKARARGMTSRYQGLRSQMDALNPGSPGWLNLVTQINLVVSQADAMYTDIHAGRRNAFSSTGAGYGDYYNFRWQSHKESGTSQALHALATVSRDAHQAHASDIYGRSIATSRAALTQAALWRR